MREEHSQWQLTSEGVIYDAGEESIVYYEPRSGDTHLLSDFAAFIIQLLTPHALSTTELVDRAMGHTNAAEAQALHDSIQAVLIELVSLDILKRN